MGFPEWDETVLESGDNAMAQIGEGSDDGNTKVADHSGVHGIQSSARL